MKGRLRSLINRILGMKLGYRMFLVYLLGGVLPMILIALYLILGTNQILVKQAENTEIAELEAVKRQILEIQNTMTTLSQYFYFNQELEEMSKKNYTSYQEIVDDYRNFTLFKEHQKYYNNIIHRIGIFFRNDTLKGNLEFAVVNDKILQQEWYQKVSTEGTGVVWAMLPYTADGKEKTLTLTRMIKTAKKEDVGVLAIYLRPARIAEILREREASTYIILNGEEVVSSTAGPEFDKLKEFLSEQETRVTQKRVALDQEAYVMTCLPVHRSDTDDTIQVVSVKSLANTLGGANRQSVRSALIAAVSVLFAMNIILIFSWSFGRRVEHFRSQMQKAAEGSFELEEKLDGNDEISELYDYLNVMILKIRKLLTEVYRERLHAEQLKASQKDAEFKMLTSQINPHFLYNTLETIRMKARVNRQYEIEELVKMLAVILRRSIQAGEKDVPIKAELELVEYYLKIQQYRFDDRIRYRIEAEEELKDYQIMPLLLQPLVENAMTHGLEGKAEDGNIEIRVCREGEYVLLSVTDDGLGIPEERLESIQKGLERGRLEGDHIGICNVGQRVKLKYGEKAGIQIMSEEGKGTRVEIRLPQA